MLTKNLLISHIFVTNIGLYLHVLLTNVANNLWQKHYGEQWQAYCMYLLCKHIIFNFEIFILFINFVGLE